MVTNNTKRPYVLFAQFPPLVTICKATLQYHNVDIDIYTERMTNIVLTHKTPSHIDGSWRYELQVHVWSMAPSSLALIFCSVFWTLWTKQLSLPCLSTMNLFSWTQLTMNWILWIPYIESKINLIYIMGVRDGWWQSWLIHTPPTLPTLTFTISLWKPRICSLFM